jgi:transcriptional repressor NrdR
MTCQKCGAETRVIDSRPAGDMIRRRRECENCRRRITTYEVTLEQFGKWQNEQREKQKLINRIRSMIELYEEERA